MPTNWCVRGSFTPAGANAWATAVSVPLYSLRAWSCAYPDLGNLPRRNGRPAPTRAPVTVRLSVTTDAHAGSRVLAELVGPDGTISNAQFTLGAGVVTAPIAGSTHSISLCYEDGVLTLFWDDVKIDYQTDLVGRVTTCDVPSLTEGALVSTGFTATGLTAAAAAYPRSDTKTRYDILWLGDSVHLNPNELKDLAGTLSTAGYQATWSLAAYGSNTMGNGFLELSDSVYAYESGWAVKARWKPLASYDMVAFNYLDNEVESPVQGTNGRMTTAEYRRGYDKIVHQATRYIPRTIMASSPPECAANFLSWTPNAATTSGQAVLSAIATKWNVPFVDYWTTFQANSPAPYTIAQLMRDTVHPTNNVGDAGITLMADGIEPYLTATVTPNAATPEIVGTVVSYLWGQPTAGTWTLTSMEQITNTYPGESANYRVAREPDRAMVASATGAKLSFPTAKFSMLFVHTIGAGTSGAFNVVVDRGQSRAVTKSFTELSSGNYPRSFFVADGFTGDAHTVEIETTAAAAVHIVGITYIGVQ